MAIDLTKMREMTIKEPKFDPAYIILKKPAIGLTEINAPGNDPMGGLPCIAQPCIPQKDLLPPKKDSTRELFDVIIGYIGEYHKELVAEANKAHVFEGLRMERVTAAKTVKRLQTLLEEGREDFCSSE